MRFCQNILAWFWASFFMFWVETFTQIQKINISTVARNYQISARGKVADLSKQFYQGGNQKLFADTQNSLVDLLNFCGVLKMV